MPKFIIKPDGSKVQIAYVLRPENSDDAVVTYSDGSIETIVGGFVTLAAANPDFIAYNGDSGQNNGSSKSNRINPDCVTLSSYVDTAVTFVIAGAGTKVVDKGSLNGLWNALPV